MFPAVSLTQNFKRRRPDEHHRFRQRAARMNISNDGLTADEIRAVIDYCHETGVMTWRCDMGKRRVKAGDIAGCITRRYSWPEYVIGYKGRIYRAHRLAWLHYYGEWPATILDHINCNPLDNSIRNLRECTQRQNLANTRLRKTNTTGRKGVSFDKSRNLYSARIRMPDGRRKTLGRFASLDDAAQAYEAEFMAQYGEFARL